MAKGDVETYCENGRWSNRRLGIDNPFAAPTFGSRDEMIEQGRHNASLFGVNHIIRHEDGTVTVGAQRQGTGHPIPLSV
ncbi:DUF2188 domain-containing protein [Arthrobacter sp. USHLN218]|uniref:DUF2188 domain-containing protein n=1 Tax=Arthrobacter sp. USHLN218 TaxID=3081232 RepID=UPI003019E816